MSFWRDEVIQPALGTDLETAVEEQEELLRRDPSNPRPYFALGALAHWGGDTEAAIEFFLKAIEIDPSYAPPHASLGRIYAVRGNDDSAWHHAREAERLGDSSLVQQLERYPAVTHPHKST